jgi:flagellar hook-associated protein 3 FlgL
MSRVDASLSGQAGALPGILGESGRIRERLDRLNAQAATGLVATNFAGLGADATRTLDLRPRLAAIATWRHNIDAAQTRMAVARSALEEIQSIAADLRARLPSLTGINGPAIEAVAAEARAGLARVAELLNSEAGGVYVFAGEDSARPPVPGANSITTSGFYQQIATAVGALASTGVAATVATTLTIAADDTVGTTVFSATLSLAAAPQVETGPNERARTGLLAHANADAVSLGGSTTGSHMRDLLRALASIGALTRPHADQAELAGLLADTGESLTGAIAAMASEAASLGRVESDLGRRRARLDATEVAITGQVTRIEDVDMALTLSELARVETRLQASYRLITGANSLSLINFLRST